MSHQPILELDELSPEIAPSPPYYGNINRSHKGAQEARERLIPRKPVFTSEAAESSEFDQQPREDLATPVVQSIPQGYEHVQGDGGHDGNLWLPGFWIQLPWRVILPLVACLACLSGTIAILVRSDGQPVDDWSVSPTVFLALLTTILNMSLRYAFKEGVVISWWYKAVRGCTVKELHKHWSSGDGFWSALGAGRHFSLVSLGSIAATLILVDQPLIQRASTVVSVPRFYLTNVTAAVAPEIPWGYTGYQSGRVPSDQVLTQPMISAFNDYNTQTPITQGFSGCKDSCSGYIEAGGLAAQCNTITGPVQYLQPSVFGLGDGPQGDTLDESNYFNDDSPFNVNFTLVGQDIGVNGTQTNNSQIWMVVAYTSDPTGNCAGTRTQRTCSLRSATLRYPVTIQNETLTLGNLTTGATVQSFQPASNSSAGIDGGGDYTWWTLGGFYIAAQSLFNANATYYFGGGIGEQVTLGDTLSNQYLENTSGTTAATNLSNLYGGLAQPCRSSWKDPTNDILSALNQIAFRVSIQAANFEYRNTNSTPTPQVITMQATGNVNVFHSEHKYMIAMIVLTTFFMALVVPTSIGWWELGRRVTLDPIEIAKAFDAPMFQGPGSNAPLRQLVKHYGSRSVKYGEAEGYSNGQLVKRQLRLGNPHDLSRPTPGALYE